MHLTRCDLALALAPFRRRPGTAAVLVTLLALACALTSVNLSVFAFLYTRPLPFANYERVLWIGQESKAQRVVGGDQQTLDNFVLLQSDLRSVERIAAFNRWRTETLRHGDTVETLTGCWITPGFFEVLGVKPALGATFANPAALRLSPRPVILSAKLWTRTFDRDPSILQQTVWLDDRPHVVVGIMSDDWLMPGYDREEQPEFWSPLNPDEIPKPDWKSRWFPTLALRRANVSLQQVQAELDVATQRLRELYPKLMTDRRLVASDLKAWLFGAHRRYFNLLVITAALLSALIVVNVVNLLLGQLADRAPYFATAQSLGANRRQVLTPLVLEHLLLLALGGALAAPLALAYRHLLVSTLGRAGLSLPAFEFDLFLATLLVGGIAVLLALLTGAKAIHRDRIGDPSRRASMRVITGRRSWADGLAVCLQTALAIALLVSCSLLALSLQRQAAANSGLPLMKLQRAFLVLRKEKYDSHATILRRMFEVKSALAAAPEVRRVALGSDASPNEENPRYTMIDDLDTVPLKESSKHVVRVNGCSDFFATIGLRIVAGRDFTEADMQSVERKMIVSQRVAELYWKNRDPIGRRILVNHRTEDWAEIVGVVQDLESPTSNEILPLVWRSMNHHPYDGVEVLFETRTRHPLPRERFQKIVASVDPEILIVDYGDVAEFLRRLRWLPEAIARLSLLLAVVASAVCGFGIFSILGRRVAASQKEIAVRKALGSPAWRIAADVGQRDVGWAIGGLVAGITLALLASQHLFALTNLRSREILVAALAGSGGVLGAALLGAVVPVVRALAANISLVLRRDT
jgi:predicted permease